MMSLKEVRRAAQVLESRLSGTVLQRIVPAGRFRLILEFYGRGETHRVLLCCRPKFARVGEAAEMPPALPAPPAIVQYLRAHFGRAPFDNVTCSPRDRRLNIRIRPRAGQCEIILSIFGNRSNIYLLDHDGLLVHAMRPLKETRPELTIGAPWREPDSAPKSEGVDRWEHIPDHAYLEAVEGEYARLERQESAEILANRLESVFRKESGHLDRKSVNLLQDLADALQAEEYRHKGELLKQALHLVRPGDERITVIDYEKGAELAIPLDPRLSASENLTAYFRRYQKELRGAGMLRRQLEQLREAQEALAAYQRKLSGLQGSGGPDLTALEELAAEPFARRLLSRYYPETKKRTPHARPPVRGKSDIPARLRPKRYSTDQGLEIWVGRSEEGNDYLTTRLAHGNDLFFPLEGCPGSHVILRTAGSATPPAESVLDACELAVHFSKLKESHRADVHMAPAKNVRKPKGAKPGLVYVTGGKTIHLRRDPKRLENVLAARIEE